jgi:hypothetical protein
VDGVKNARMSELALFEPENGDGFSMIEDADGEKVRLKTATVSA